MDREITLRDYGRVLWSGRWLIVATTLVAAFVGLLLTFAASSSYTAKAKVFLGQATTISGVIAQTPDTSPLTAPDVLTGDDVILGVSRRLGVSESRVRDDSSVEIARPPGNLGANQPTVATIVFQDGSRAVSERGRTTYAEVVLAKLNAKFDAVQNTIRRRKVLADAEVARLQTQIPVYAREATRASDPTHVALYQSLLFAAQTQLSTAQQDADQNALLLANAQRIEAPSIVSTSTDTVSSRSLGARLRTILFAAIIGFLVGVIVTFVWKGSPAGRAAQT